MVGEARDPDGERGPLDGVTVVDASQVLVGPFCTMQLGDMGADVIKIERPEVGDQTRGWHPPSFGDEDEGLAAYYASVNRNKRSITVDLTEERGREIVRELAADADVFVENFRVGAADGWNLGYDDLSAVNPELVYCSLSGYGEWGPYAEHAAYDLMIQAESGLMSITGEEGGKPVRVGVAIADIGAGMYATQAILAALFRREFGDVGGQKIDVSLLDGQLAWMSYMATYYFASGEPPERMGSKHPTIVPYQAFPTQDGHAVVAAASEKTWRNLCRVLGREELIDDERFERNTDRVANRELLEEILCAEIEPYETDEIVSKITDAGVPAAAVRDMAEAFDHPQVAAREMAVTTEHPTAGEIEMPGVPMYFSDTPPSVRRHPPSLGEHTAEVLAELGYGSDEIDRLNAEDVV